MEERTRKVQQFAISLQEAEAFCSRFLKNEPKDVYVLPFELQWRLTSSTAFRGALFVGRYDSHVPVQHVLADANEVIRKAREKRLKEYL